MTARKMRGEQKTVFELIEAQRQRIRDLEVERAAIETELAVAKETLAAEPTILRCIDCRMPYGNFPLDMTFPDEQWRLIHAPEGGVLCANCMVRRAAGLSGAVVVRATIEFSKEEASLACGGTRVEPTVSAPSGQEHL